MPTRSRRPRAGILLSAILLGVGSDCTPLGLWMYEDPTVAIAAARLRPGAPATAEIDLVIRNANDFDLTLTASSVTLDLGERRVAQAELSHDITLARNYANPVTVILPAGEPGPALRAAADRQEETGYQVSAAMRIRTPIGVRRVHGGQGGRAMLGVADSAGTILIRMDHPRSGSAAKHAGND